MSESETHHAEIQTTSSHIATLKVLMFILIISKSFFNYYHF